MSIYAHASMDVDMRVLEDGDGVAGSRSAPTPQAVGPCCPGSFRQLGHGQNSFKGGFIYVHALGICIHTFIHIHI